MTEDPWRRPDPDRPPPQYAPPPYGAPPQYAPPPGYGYGPPPGYAPYAPPGYYQPLPKRGGLKRLIWLLSVLGVLVLGGCATGIYFLVGALSKNADAVNAFLKDVRDQRFSAAYDRLCPSAQAAQPRAEFTDGLHSAAADGRGVSSYDITSSKTQTTNGSTERTAGGDVTFGDGRTRDITFSLGKSNGTLCINGGYDLLD
jgi:hypothetical protein